MYDNIGGKIKGLAKATFIVEAIAAIIVGISLWVETEEWWCALILFCGPIVAWVSSWLLYGFGEIIDKLSIAEEENAVIIECPDCGEELFFDKELSYAECPYCGCNIKIK